MALKGLAHPLHLSFKQLLTLGFIAGITVTRCLPETDPLQLAQLQRRGCSKGNPRSQTPLPTPKGCDRFP